MLPRDTDQASALARRHNTKVKGRAQIAFDANRPLRHALEVRHPSFLAAGFVELLRKR